MPNRFASWFPHNTVPECREYFQQAPLEISKNSAKKAPRNAVVFWQATSVDGWVAARYVQFAAVTAQGAAVSYGNTGKAKVVKAASAANSQKYAGFPLVAQSVSTWGWIQVFGPNVYRLVTDKTAKIGSMLVKDQTTAGMIRPVTLTAPGTQLGWILATALQSDSGSFMAPGKAWIRAGF